MEEIREGELRSMSASEKILHLLKTHGEMSSKEISDTLNMKKKNVDSLVSRLTQKGKTYRVSAGIYRIKE